MVNNVILLFNLFILKYENQQNVLSNWTSKAMMRPKFSDAEGDVSTFVEYAILLRFLNGI